VASGLLSAETDCASLLAASNMLVVLALASLALAQSTPSIATTGPARILFQNDLSTNYSTPALYLSRGVGYEAAASACQAFNEQLLSDVSADIQLQLNYLLYAGELSSSSMIWLSGTSSNSSASSAAASATSNVPARFKRQSSCTAFTPSSKQLAAVDCAMELPVLCTQSAPPFSIAAANVTAGSQVSIPLNESTVTGYRDARSFRFLGIPYAQSPVGQLRFQPAQPLNTSAASVSALDFGASCVQSQRNGSFPVSEDCLFLNVWTPALPSTSNGTSGNSTSKGLPVAFWIYGGQQRVAVSAFAHLL
jgi:hypothetical protein